MHRLIPIAAALLAVALGLPPFFRNIELDTYDLRVAARARPAAPSDQIVLIAIDNESLRRMEPLVAEAASSELIDPSRALQENLDAPALNVRLPAAECVERRPRVTLPFPALARVSRGIGHSLLTLDSDGPLRRIAPVVQIGERTIPSISMATAMATGITPVMRVAPMSDTANAAR